MNDHTPGPWHSMRYTDTGTLAVSTDMGHHLAEVVRDHYGTALPDAANARLIAAAPGMLAALKLALFGVTRDYEVNGEIDRHAITGVLRDAIATATQEDANR